MRKLLALLLLSIISCLLPAGASAQKARRTRKASAPPVICTIASVPKGMVVVGYKRNSACSDGAELIVKRPANGDIICAESPLPPQFSIVTEAQGGSTGTCPKKAFLISGSASGAASSSRTTSLVDDDSIGRAFASRASNIEVEGEGTVNRLLSDDLNAPRHQRFIVELASRQTLLMTHNIDLAPRINGLRVGDVIRFKGEYVWNEKGGVIHWTHHDPQNRHVAGWILHNGKRYQ